MTTYRIQPINNIKPQLSDLGFFADIQFDADDTAPIYIGMHLTKGASNSDTNWKIYKNTYSGSAITRIQLAYGAWSNRASLF
jgi:hypothetical protein